MNVVVPTSDELLEQIRSELAVLDPGVPIDRVRTGVGIASLALESVTLLSLVAELEGHYSVRVPDEALASLTTVDDLVELFRAAVAERSTSVAGR